VSAKTREKKFASATSPTCGEVNPRLIMIKFYLVFVPSKVINYASLLWSAQRPGVENVNFLYLTITAHNNTVLCITARTRVLTTQKAASLYLPFHLIVVVVLTSATTAKNLLCFFC
jgi:hypothetical protein